MLEGDNRDWLAYRMLTGNLDTTHELMVERAKLGGQARKRKGYTPSQETRDKISRTTKGRPKSEEWKQKMRGRTHTAETREKLSKINKGRKQSPEWAEKSRQNAIKANKAIGRNVKCMWTM